MPETDSRRVSSWHLPFPPRCPEDQDSSEKEKEIPPSAAPQASPLHAVSFEGHAVPKRRCKIQNNHREVAALTAPSPMLFHFFRTSFADATGPFDRNVAAGPSSIRMHEVEHVSQRITRLPLHAVAGDSNAVPNGGGEIENDHRKIMSSTTMLFDFFRTSFSNLAGPVDSNVAAGPSSIRIKHTFVVAEQATSRSHPCRAPKSLTRFPLAAPPAPPSHAVASCHATRANGGYETHRSK
jgi:hypothetical protein